MSLSCPVYIFTSDNLTAAYENQYGEFFYEGVHYRDCLHGELSSQQSADEEEKQRKVRAFDMMRELTIAASASGFHHA
jgi:hypothetical protein